MKKLICECCGAPINPKTYKCEYCGTQYKREADKVIRIETFTNPVDTYTHGIELNYDFVECIGHDRASELAIHKLTNALAKQIAPYMKIEVEEDELHRQYRLRSQVKVVRPEERGFRW